MKRINLINVFNYLEYHFGQETIDEIKEIGIELADDEVFIPKLMASFADYVLSQYLED